MQKKIALFGKEIAQDAGKYVEVMLEELEKHGATMYIHHELKNQAAFAHVFSNKKTPETWSTYKELAAIHPDCLITLGGDGTILKAVTLIRDTGIPILGINSGRLGFLANVARHEIVSAINDLILGHYALNERKLLEVEFTKGEQPELNFALNEITVARKDTTSMVTVHSWINDEFLSSYWADGLIIATPTGSTGYSLSCGGPIIMPGSETFVLTPISPHNLNVRPFVIPNHFEITLRIQSREPSFLVSLDSRIHTLPINTELRIRKANFTIKMVQTEQQRFTKTLREKLFWGIDIRN